jgi:small subunit ribosomal protein S3
LGQKTHPIGFRLGVINNWDSSWYDDKSFATKLKEDSMIRGYIRKRFDNAGISKIEIERTVKKIT